MSLFIDAPLIHVYNRADALADGFLIDVSEMASQARFKVPAAMTREAWADCVEWTEQDSARQGHQDQKGRLWDVLWMCALRAVANKDNSEFAFKVRRIPRDGSSTAPQSVALKANISPGDQMEPVLTIMLIDQD